ncbi:MAG: serine/threonine protein kinase [Myxococcaceae bacterium]|nr:serine/threonine protein kinase [Myxococcaceae bacterium]
MSNEPREPVPSHYSDAHGDLELGPTLHVGHLSSLALARRRSPTASTYTHVIRQLKTQNVGSSHVDLVSREKAFVGRINSAHVVTCCAGGGPGSDWSIQPYVEGLTLEVALERDSRDRVLPSRVLVPVLYDVLLGLAELHGADTGQAARYVHQAPTPRHIVIGLDGRARLIDLTQAIGGDAAWSAQLNERLTISEMAPEQLASPAHVDGRADIFIAATTLWHVLLGQPLFAAADPHEQMRRVMRMPIPTLSDVGVRVHGDLERLLERALTRDRMMRLGTAKEFASELRVAAMASGLFAPPEEVGEFIAMLQKMPSWLTRRDVNSDRRASAKHKATLIGTPGMIDYEPVPSDAATRPSWTSPRGPRSRTLSEHAYTEAEAGRRFSVLVGSRVPVVTSAGVGPADRADDASAAYGDPGGAVPYSSRIESPGARAFGRTRSFTPRAMLLMAGTMVFLVAVFMKVDLGSARGLGAERSNGADLQQQQLRQAIADGIATAPEEAPPFPGALQQVHTNDVGAKLPELVDRMPALEAVPNVTPSTTPPRGAVVTPVRRAPDVSLERAPFGTRSIPARAGARVSTSKDVATNKAPVAGVRSSPKPRGMSAQPKQAPSTSMRSWQATDVSSAADAETLLPDNPY